MAREPEKTREVTKPAPKDDTKTEQEKAPENTQSEPYPTGNPPPARNHLGQPVDDKGNVIEET